MMSTRSISAIALVIAAGCSQTKQPAPVASVNTPTEIVRASAIPDTRVTTGTVRASTVSQLSSKVVGNVTRVLVSEGDHVRRGQLLLEVDDRDVRARDDQARAALSGTDQSIAAATAAISAAQANATFAEATYNRYAALRERGSVSPYEFEEVAAKRTAAQSDLERARRSRQQLLAQRAQSRAGVAEAEAYLGYTRVTAPIDGIVAARFVDAGAQAAPGVPLITVEDASNRRVETTVDEQLATTIRAGDAVTVDGVAAHIARIAPLDPATRTALVKIALPADAPLRSGAFVRVAFTIGSRSAVTVPANAIVRHGQLTSVFVVDRDNVARMRLVTIGDAAVNRVELLSGLDEGERIVTAAAAVSDGVRVVWGRPAAAASRRAGSPAITFPIGGAS